MTRARWIAATAAAVIAMASPVIAQDIAVTNAKLVLGDGSGPIDGGTVVVRGGRVVAVGRNVGVPAGMRTIDAQGRFVTPGLVAGYSQVGLIEVDAVDESNDTETDHLVYSAAIDIAPALNPLGEPVGVGRAAGVTRALVYPGSSGQLFNGRGALVDLGKDADMVTRAGLFQYVQFGETGAARTGGSRAATFLMFREMLAEARDYGRNPAAYDGRSKDSLLTRGDAQALLRVLRGDDRLFIQVNRAADIRAVLGLRREYPAIRITLIGAAEGWMVARDIAQAGVPVIAHGLRDLPQDFESLGATQSNIGRMRAAGVNVSIGQIDDDGTMRPYYARQYAGNLVAITQIPGASGLSWDQAMVAITSGPASAAGVDDLVGSLRPGRVGDVVIWSGDPLELSSAPQTVIIDGVEQDLTTRQTRLRDRYRTPAPTALPKAYDR